MKTLLVVALSAAAALAQTQVKNPHASEADRKAGALIFRSHCAPCHGVKGTGGLGPNLTTGRFFHGSSDADLYRNIGDGIEGTAMPGVFFDGTQVWQIVAFVKLLSQSAPPQVVRGNASRGEQLFRETGCGACHLLRGEGGIRGPDLSIIGSQRAPAYLRESILNPGADVAQQYWVAKIITRDGASHAGFLMNQDTYMVQILDFERGLSSIPRAEFKDFGIDRTSIMPSYKGKLSDTDVDDIVSYLSSLTRPQEKSE